MDPDGKIWFPAKRHGWGWGFPCSWEGWVVMAGYVFFVFGGIVLLDHRASSTRSLLLIAYIILLTIALLVICYVKGETPRWRWGDKDSTNL